jgi:LPXTG-motif cell wall-anchored protein
MRHRAIVIALFVTALCAAVLTMGTFGANSAHAQTSSSCDISKFKNPDGSLDTTGYLACVQAASVSAPKPSPDCPTAELQLAAQADPATLSPGQTTNFTAVGFAPNSDVTIFICSTPVNLGTFQADSTGRVATTVTVPAGTTLGAHTLAAVGARSNGIQQVAYAAIQVVSPAPSTGTLPTTGSDSGKLIAMGAALVVLGGAAVFGSTRARRPAMVETD